MDSTLIIQFNCGLLLCASQFNPTFIWRKPFNLCDFGSTQLSTHLQIRHHSSVVEVGFFLTHKVKYCDFYLWYWCTTNLIEGPLHVNLTAPCRQRHRIYYRHFLLFISLRPAAPCSFRSKQPPVLLRLFFSLNGFCQKVPKNWIRYRDV